MSTRTRARIYRDRRARDLTREAIRGAGTLAAVGAVMTPPRGESAVGNWVTSTDSPELAPIFRILIGLEPWSDAAVLRGLRAFAALNLDSTTSARQMALCLLRAVVAQELLGASLETLVGRANYLRSHRHELNSRECAAGETGCDSFPDELEAEGDVQWELAEALRILRFVHGIPCPGGMVPATAVIS